MPKIFKTDIESEADLKVLECDVRSEAHLVFYETTSMWEATKVPLWCFVEIRGEADKTVFFVDAKASLSRG